MAKSCFSESRPGGSTTALGFTSPNWQACSVPGAHGEEVLTSLEDARGRNPPAAPDASNVVAAERAFVSFPTRRPFLEVI